MTLDAWWTLAVIVIVIATLASERLSASMTLLGATVVLLVTGVLTPAQAFSGFSNSAPITVAALYVVARAIERTGVVQPFTLRVLGDGTRPRRSLLRLVVPTIGLSAFVNNTPIVALMAPPVNDWAHKHGLSPSRFLMPLSYATILGGVITTVGTSTNLVVSGLLEADGQAPFALFEITRVGLPVALVGGALLVWLAPILLPERRAGRLEFEEGTREFVMAMRVLRGGALDGRIVEEAGLRHLQGVFLFRIDRGAEVIAPVAPTTALRGGDLLSFAGRVDTVVDVQGMAGLESAEAKHLDFTGDASLVLLEAVVGPQSPLVGRTLREAAFRGRYQAAVLAIHRAGARMHAKLGDVRLGVGDTLLLLSDENFVERWRHRRDFLLVARLGGSPFLPKRHRIRVTLILAALAVVMAFGYLPILEASLIACIALVAARVLRAREIADSVDLDVIVMIAASFGLGAAMETTGLAAALASGLGSAFSFAGDHGPLLGIVVATAILTEIVTNNAAAALMYPIGAATAISAGLDVRAVAIAVAVAASASFLTPLGYQTNIMVYGLGGYRFTDYARLGFPLTVASVALIVWLC